MKNFLKEENLSSVLSHEEARTALDRFDKLSEKLLKRKKNSDSSNSNVLCSIRLSKKEKEDITSLKSGLTQSIRFLFQFYERWKNIDSEIKAYVKLSAIEFAQTTALFLKAKEENQLNEINILYQTMIVQATQLKRTYQLLQDQSHEYLHEIFSDKTYLDYLKFIWLKHCP
ncbi:MAG: hypothetical protein HQK50_12805 [Oligoflexia bacterium]|nr:hypothetical protein [Oligoflexia bacterium]MBF0366444.1 hypothetical protein [Oligoflexia bacterium]